jgi:methylthioribose-1-phosphate isomerase
VEKKQTGPDFANVALSDDETTVIILDQTGLPGEVEYLFLTKPEQMHDALRTLKVRGAPAIGIFAAACMVAVARRLPDDGRTRFLGALGAFADYLASARPTAVNLSWALTRMRRAAANCPEISVKLICDELGREYKRIKSEDEKACLAIAKHGLSLLRDGGILTHCNAGALAASRYGTALGPVLLGQEQGRRFHVFVDETRPLLQGARLSAWELMRAGVKTTLICDSMAACVMKQGLVGACLVGFDRVARNGDTANKIGTLGLAVLAHHYNIPFYVLGPVSSIDFECPDGDGIVVEQRDPREITSQNFVRPVAPEGAECFNPAFDVTDAKLITAIITEAGICRPPYEKSLAALVKQC